MSDSKNHNFDQKSHFSVKPQHFCNIFFQKRFEKFKFRSKITFFQKSYLLVIFTKNTLKNHLICNLYLCLRIIKLFVYFVYYFIYKIFILIGNGLRCYDLDECLDNPCDSSATCTNTSGSYECACNTGYSGNGAVCYDVNECMDEPCGDNANCTNNDGSFECACRSGFNGDGFNCVDSDECKDSPCDANATCSNTAGGFECSCRAGYKGYYYLF